MQSRLFLVVMLLMTVCLATLGCSSDNKSTARNQSVSEVTEKKVVAIPIVDNKSALKARISKYLEWYKGDNYSRNILLDFLEPSKYREQMVENEIYAMKQQNHKLTKYSIENVRMNEAETGANVKIIEDYTIQPIGSSLKAPLRYLDVVVMNWRKTDGKWYLVEQQVVDSRVVLDMK